MIIDAHQHFCFAKSEYGLDDYSPDHYLADVAPLTRHLCATVFAECNTHYDQTVRAELQSVGETRFAAALGEKFAAAPIRLAAAIIAHADPFEAYSRALKHLDEKSRLAIFGGNAARIYRVEPGDCEIG